MNFIDDEFATNILTLALLNISIAIYSHKDHTLTLINKFDTINEIRKMKSYKKNEENKLHGNFSDK